MIARYSLNVQYNISCRSKINEALSESFKLSLVTEKTIETKFSYCLLEMTLFLLFSFDSKQSRNKDITKNRKGLRLISWVCFTTDLISIGNKRVFELL